jgi:hypothetical protein
MKLLFTLITIILISNVAAASKVAIAPLDFVDHTTGEPIEGQPLKQLEDKIFEGAKAAGYEVISGTIVLDAITEKAGDTGCDSSCMQEVAQKLDADEIIIARIIDEDQTNFTVDIAFTISGRSISQERTDGFFVVLEWIKGTVSLILKEIDTSSKSTSTVVDSEPQPQPEPETITPEPSRKKLGKAPLLISALTTTAFAVTYLVVDGAANKKYNITNDNLSLKNNNDLLSYINKDFEDDKKTINNLHLTRNIFLVATATGLLTTIVLSFFTDFSPNSEGLKARTLANFKFKPIFAVSENSGLLGFEGRFK